MKHPFSETFDEISATVLLALQISNTSKKNHDIILFDKDFKLPKGVEIKSEADNVTYEQILMSISQKDIVCDFIRAICIEYTPQASQPFQQADKDEDIFSTYAYFSPYQNQAGIVDIPSSFIITKDTKIRINILSGVEDYTIYFCKFKSKEKIKSKKSTKEWFKKFIKPQKNPAKNIQELSKILNIHDVNNDLPVVLYITNKSSKSKKATLFFSGDNYILDNHGQDKDIKIESGNTCSSYNRVLSYFLGHKMRFSFVRLRCSSNPAQIRKIIKYRAANIEGQQIEIPVYTKMSLSVYQQQIDCNDVKLNHTIDEGSGYEIEMLPNTTLTAYFYPALS